MKILNRHVKNDLSAYLQNELTREQVNYIEQHLAICKDCKKECEEIEQGISWAKQLTLASCPESLWNNIEVQLNAQTQIKDGNRPSQIYNLLPTRAWVRVCAMAFVVMICVLFLNGLLSKKNNVVVNVKPLNEVNDRNIAFNSTRYGESDNLDGRSQHIQTPVPTTKEAKEKYEVSPSGNVLRSFERGSSLVGLPSDIGSSKSDRSLGKSNIKLPERVFGTKLHTDPNYQGKTIPSVALPINKRNFLDFSLTSPRVTVDNVSAQGAVATSGLSFNGQQARTNTITIDGTDNNDPKVKSSVYSKNSQTITEQVDTNESYKNYGVNPWTDSKKDHFSTFAVDVDTASYTIARRKLTENTLPPADCVRVEEFVNYFKYKYPEPATTHPFSLTMEAATSPFNADHYLLRIGIKGREVPIENRLPAHLTFLVDTSGSMESEDKIGLVKKSLKMLVNHLEPKDTIAITTYAGDITLVLSPTSASNKEAILSAIDNLQSGGGTAMESGIDLAYSQASSSFTPNSINRVIICSDGDANIGNTSHKEILEKIENYVKKGITVTTLGFGDGNYKDEMMEQFADKGNGNYFYIDRLSQARRIFVEQLSGTLQVIAKDVKVQVEFDPKTVSEYRLIGYENRDIADKDFRNDEVDAGEIGAGHTVTAIYELKLQKNPQGSLATIRLRYKTPDAEKTTPAQEVAASFEQSRIKQNFAETSEDFRFSVAVAAFAEVLRGSVAAKDWSLDKIANISETALETNPERQEFFQLVKKAQQLRSKK